MCGWMDECVGGWKNGSVLLGVDGWLDECGWMDEWIRVGRRWMDGWIEECVGGWMNGSVLVWVDG